MTASIVAPLRVHSWLGTLWALDGLLLLEIQKEMMTADSLSWLPGLHTQNRYCVSVAGFAVTLLWVSKNKND